MQTLPPDAANVTATVSKSEVRVAEPFTLDLTITAPAGSRVSLPAVGEQLGEFDVIDHHDIIDIPSEVSPDQRSWHRRLTLESIATGNLEIPSLEIQVTRGTDSMALKSDALPLRVVSVLEDRADPTRFRDIHSVVDAVVAEPKSLDLIWWAAGGLGLLTLGAAAIALGARRKIWLAPGEWAFRKLEEIRESTAMQAGDSEAVTCELSSVLCDYLQLQFEPAAQVKTADELLHVIEAAGLVDRKLGQRFAQLFANADQVKFAGLRLANVELDNMIENARELIATASSGDRAGNFATAAVADNPNPSDNTIGAI